MTEISLVTKMFGEEHKSITDSELSCLLLSEKNIENPIENPTNTSDQDESLASYLASRSFTSEYYTTGSGFSSSSLP